MISIIDLPELGLTNLNNKLIHISGCNAAQYLTSKKYEGFLKQTGAKAISGYSKSVDWFESALLEQALIFECSDHSSLKRALTSLEKKYPDLIEKTGFKMVVR